MNVIEVKNLTKIYKIYNAPKDRLKEAMSIFRKKQYHHDFYALTDVSFSIDKGETLGIIGKNGAGKSTLLKLITSIITPTSGDISVKGRVSALLELGAGFNMEYTGIENIYLQGTLMGFSKSEMEKKIPDILKFADIGEFVYQQVKTYSSGMFVRLAFATAINVEPDILIVDEALAVGDVFFQNKCYRKFAEMRDKGITIIFVSHDMGSVKQFCDRVIWLKNGQIEAYGDKYEVTSKYLSWEFEERGKTINLDQQLDETKFQEITVNEERTKYPKLKTNNIEISGSMEAEILSFYAEDSDHNITNSLTIQHDYLFTIVAKFNADVNNVIFGFVIENVKGLHVYTTNSYLNNTVLKNAKKDEIYKVDFQFKLPRFARGNYLVSPAVAVGSQDEHKTLCWYHNVIKIDIENPGFNMALIEFENEVEIHKQSKDTMKMY